MILKETLNLQLETFRLKKNELKEKYVDLFTTLISEMNEKQLDSLTGFYINSSQRIDSIDQDNLTLVVDEITISIDDLNINEIDSTIEFIINNIIKN